MPFHWTKEEIQALQLRISYFGYNDYIREHGAYLRLHLKKFKELKSPSRKAQIWEQVEDEARRLETWVRNLEYKKGQEGK